MKDTEREEMARGVNKRLQVGRVCVFSLDSGLVSGGGGAAARHLV